MNLEHIQRIGALRRNGGVRLAGALLAAVVVVTATGADACAGYGSPILERGRFGLGVNGRRFTRDVYDVERDMLSNPEDSFGYVALEARMGLWRRRLDFAIEVSRASNSEDEFPERDYLTWELGFTLRGLLYERPDHSFFLQAGIHYRDTVGFDRGETLTHKLRRNLEIFGFAGRPLHIAGKPARLYGGPLYSRHRFFDYGASFLPGKGPGEGESRDNLLLAAGLGVFPVEPLEIAAELSYRNNLSFGISSMLTF